MEDNVKEKSPNTSKELLDINGTKAESELTFKLTTTNI